MNKKRLSILFLGYVLNKFDYFFPQVIDQSNEIHLFARLCVCLCANLFDDVSEWMNVRMTSTKW